VRLFDGTYARLPLAHLRTGRLAVAKVDMQPVYSEFQHFFPLFHSHSLLCLLSFSSFFIRLFSLYLSLQGDFAPVGTGGWGGGFGLGDGSTPASALPRGGGWGAYCLDNNDNANA